jgi:hypothetical protein
LYQSKNWRQKALASSMQPKRRGKRGWYFRVLKWLSENGLCVPWQGALLSLVKIQAGKLSLQPEALGADQEATNGLKHLEKRPRRGSADRAGRNVSEHRAGLEISNVGADPP